jgi:DNA-binding beta-propeller fold protein YncE
LDRAIISGFWGFSVIDLISKKVLKKIRTGFLPRAAVLDEENNLIFVGSTFDGKIRVFNRNTYKLLKTIPVGYGVRYLLVEKSGKNLLFGNNLAHYSLPIKSI